MTVREEGASSLTLPDEIINEAKLILARYPKGRQASALMPMLDLAQRWHGGWLTPQLIDAVCDYLEVPRIRGYEVATFYTMYNHKPCGRFHVQVCTTTPCWLRGSAEVLLACQEKLKIHPGETTADEMFGLSEVECLGACVNAPVVQINDAYFEDLSAETMTSILDKLAFGEPVTQGSQTRRQGSAPQGDSQSMHDLEKKIGEGLQTKTLKRKTKSPEIAGVEPSKS